MNVWSRLNKILASALTCKVGKITAVAVSGKKYTLQDHGGQTFIATSTGTHSINTWCLTQNGVISEEIPIYLAYHEHYIE